MRCLHGCGGMGGMYVCTEIKGREPEVVWVPFLRAMLDERDARWAHVREGGTKDPVCKVPGAQV